MRLRTSLALPASIALVLGALAVPNLASADPEQIAGPDSGIGEPSGVVEDPDGRGVWITSDLGVCRVELGAEPRLVQDSPWCGPEDPENEGEEDEGEEGEVEADGLVTARKGAGAPSRPGAASGLAFDAQTDNFYVGDRDSTGGGVWRLHLDRTTGKIDGGVMLAYIDDRVQTVALGPLTATGRDLYYVTKRDPKLMRISSPGSTPSQPEQVAVVGDVTGLAASDDALYLADGSVEKLSLAPGASAVPVPVDGFEGPVSAVAVDAAHARLYAATEGHAPEDIVEALDLSRDGAAPERYEQGLAVVSALGVTAGGDLVIGASDPAEGTGPFFGEPRLWRVAYQDLDRPRTEITRRPAAYSPARDVTFAYASRSGATFECRLDGAAYEDCDGSGSGETTYDDLPEGEHRFSVRARDGLTGLAESVRFMLDRTAPRVTVTQPTDDFVDGGPAPRVHFSAYESDITYTCSVDGAAFKPCFSGNGVDGLGVGDHVLRVAAVDQAGNASDPDDAAAAARIRVRARAHTSTSRPVAPAAVPSATPTAAAPTQAPAATAEPKPLLYPFTLRVRGSSRKTLHLAFGLRAPAEAAQLRVAIKDARGRTVLTRTLTVREGQNHLRLVLRPRLKPGRYVVTATLRSARGIQGNPQSHRLRITAPRG